jgi:hypothetical protein
LANLWVIFQQHHPWVLKKSASFWGLNDVVASVLTVLPMQWRVLATSLAG